MPTAMGSALEIIRSQAWSRPRSGIACPVHAAPGLQQGWEQIVGMDAGDAQLNVTGGCG